MYSTMEYIALGHEQKRETQYNFTFIATVRKS
jgi:hypothetical protein